MLADLFRIRQAHLPAARDSQLRSFIPSLRADSCPRDSLACGPARCRFDGPARFKARWKRGLVLGPAHLPKQPRGGRCRRAFRHEPAPPETAAPSPDTGKPERLAIASLAAFGSSRARPIVAAAQQSSSPLFPLALAGVAITCSNAGTSCGVAQWANACTNGSRARPLLPFRCGLSSANTVARSAACVIAFASALAPFVRSLAESLRSSASASGTDNCTSPLPGSICLSRSNATGSPGRSQRSELAAFRSGHRERKSCRSGFASRRAAPGLMPASAATAAAQDASSPLMFGGFGGVATTLNSCLTCAAVAQWPYALTHRSRKRLLLPLM